MLYTYDRSISTETYLFILIKPWLRLVDDICPGSSSLLIFVSSILEMLYFVDLKFVSVGYLCSWLVLRPTGFLWECQLLCFTEDFSRAKIWLILRYLFITLAFAFVIGIVVLGIDLSSLLF